MITQLVGLGLSSWYMVHSVFCFEVAQIVFWLRCNALHTIASEWQQNCPLRRALLVFHGLQGSPFIAHPQVLML